MLFLKYLYLLRFLIFGYFNNGFIFLKIQEAWESKHKIASIRLMNVEALPAQH